MERASWGFEEGERISASRSALKSIGGGTRYEVYLVWDEELFALGVAKLLRPDQVEDEGALTDLRDEAEALASVAHPVIVRGFDAVLDGPHPHLLIEHLEGPSLRRLIKRDRALSSQQVVPLALSVAGALAYLARRRMVHLDVKPDNLIMGVPPRLIDLSIARGFERAAGSVGPLGTDAYMAPEQCGAQAKSDFGPIGSAADVWGLGATLHHALSGDRPFPRGGEDRESGDPLVRFPQLHADAPPLPDYLPAGLRELISSMLRRGQAERPTAADVAERLEPIVGDLPDRLSMSRRALG